VSDMTTTSDDPSASDRVGRRLLPTSILLAEIAEMDAEYQRQHFVTLTDLCEGRPERLDELRALIRTGAIPQPAYADEQGNELVRPDYLALWVGGQGGGCEHRGGGQDVCGDDRPVASVR